ncbi:MAG: amidase, partial [Brevibacterium aurantiacum]
MNELTTKSALELAAGLKAGEFSSVEVTQAHLDRIHATEADFGSFITVTDDLALETAKAVDAKRSASEDVHALAGVPVALKDLIVTEGVATTAASKMLENWVPPYESTVHNKVKAAGLPVLGKTNLDEFAMGSTTEHSAFGTTRNPWNLEHVPGGSSGGAAAALAGFQAPLSVGTDTGGSVRQPAAFTGTVGVKPTYGSISRFGIIAMASSLDQVGPMGRSVADAAALHELLAGHDPLDSTSLPDPVAGFVSAAQTSDLKGKKLGVIKQLRGEGYQDGVRDAFSAA